MPAFIIPKEVLASGIKLFDSNQDAYKYQLQVARGNFLAENILLDTILTDTKIIFPYELEGSTMYRWRVREVSTLNNPWSTGRFYTRAVTFSSEDNKEFPSNFTLTQNFPNPFNPSTNIRYGLPERAFVLIRIYDVIGREVSTLVNEEKNAGYHNVVFDIGTLASGVYLYRLEATPTAGSGNDTFSQTRYMTIIK